MKEDHASILGSNLVAHHVQYRRSPRLPSERGPTFHWQAGYGAFSVSQSAIEQVIEYIENQCEHHRKMTFQEEFRFICRKHEIVIDERYAWD